MTVTVALEKLKTYEQTSFALGLNETDDMLLCGETTEKADSTIALPA